MAGKNFDISRFAGTITPVRSESDTMREIAIDKILDNPRNFYPKPDAKALEALEDSIRANGLLEPPTVIAAEDGTSYRLISGHSRMAALRELNEGEPDKWDKVLCRVLPTMSEGQEQAAVIEANRQRVKSNALLADEAEKLTAAYIKRREAGEQLPGRIRDYVAEALRVNSTKLANLAAIKRGIKAPELLSAWEQGKIPEAAALEIARMDTDTQFRLSDWTRNNHKPYTIREVRKFNLIWACCRHKCPHTAGLCPNAETMHDTCYKGGAWQLCAGCCEQCLRRDTCPAACQYVERRPSPEPEQEAEPLPEGQMVICGWMPGGTTPAEPGEFAVVVDVGGGKRLKRFFEWDGRKWMMTSGIEASIAPAWWMRLPPVPDKEG